MGPFGHCIELAFSLTIESNPVDKIAPNHSPSTSPQSIEDGLVVVTDNNCSSSESRLQPNVRTKSLPVPAGITVNGI